MWVIVGMVVIVFVQIIQIVPWGMLMSNLRVMPVPVGMVVVMVAQEGVRWSGCLFIKTFSRT